MAYSLTYSYNSTSQSYSVTGYSDITKSDNVVIPSTYDDGTNGEHPVTSIDRSAFKNCSSLTNVVIGNSVTSISAYAFGTCKSLVSIIIPDSVTSIGAYAFNNCSSLTSITIGNGVKSIQDGAFLGCSGVTSVVIGDDVMQISTNTFYGCTNLKQLILFPSSPPSLITSAIPTTISKIYVQQSSKAKYQAAKGWSAFATKIVSDNLYLSFVRFNQKNKEYIDEKIKELKEYIDSKL